MEVIDGERWPIIAYREACDTIGREITWEPAGSGLAVDVDEQGGLIVETPEGTKTVHSGAVSHIR
jgi:BirA family biotin operon repressor/biotin-[acetyl-CoA-carboxylase] ligase